MTVYRIMDFLHEDAAPELIARELDLSLDQVRAAIDYIEKHRTALDVEYGRLAARAGQPRPPSVEAGRAASAEELKQRILARQTGVANAGRRGQ